LIYTVADLLLAACLRELKISPISGVQDELASRLVQSGVRESSSIWLQSTYSLARELGFHQAGQRLVRREVRKAGLLRGMSEVLDG
jgi:hypothetical protein